MISAELKYTNDLRLFYMGSKKKEPKAPDCLNKPWFNLEALKSREKEKAEIMIEFNRKFRKG